MLGWITARIRRRQEANTGAGEAVQAGGESAGQETLPTEAAENPSRKPVRTFQERIALERQQDGRGPELP